MTVGGGGPGWTWRRVLALVLCLLVFALTVRPHPVDAAAEPGVHVTASFGAGDATGDPEGEAATHCTHCGCAFVGLECLDPPRPAPRPPLPRFTAGARAVPDAVSRPEAPPPRT